MDIINIEIKAYCRNPSKMDELLIACGAEYKGLDHQIDTYFNVQQGRLKLREGNVEHSLIYYQRVEVKDLKQSNIVFNRLAENSGILLKQLEQSLGVMVVVDKKRHIYFVDNVKFHLDDVKGLGTFVEIEAIGKAGEEESLQKQCAHFMKYLCIDNKDLIDKSYSDMVKANGG